jgi:hypothetical protein
MNRLEGDSFTARNSNPGRVAVFKITRVTKAGVIYADVMSYLKHPSENPNKPKGLRFKPNERNHNLLTEIKPKSELYLGSWVEN